MIYLDNAATTKVDNIAIEKMVEIMSEDFGNPSALYNFGLKAEKIINESRKQIAKVLNVSDKEIYFTSSGTEGNNIAINGVISFNKLNKYITTEIEHSSVYNYYKDIVNDNVIFLKTDKYGYIDLSELEKNIDVNTKLVSIMHVNNELGTIQDLEAIGSIIKNKNSNTIFHVDGIQGFCKIPVDINKCKIDIYTISGHKINGPKGIGAIYIREGIKLKPLIIGGGQEKGISPGTENTPGIGALGIMAETKGREIQENFEYVNKLKEYLLNKLKGINDLIVNSPMDNASPYILSVSIKNIRGEVLLHFLEMDEIYISVGAACGKNKVSRVVKSLNLPKGYEDGTIRISFSKYTTKEELDILYDKMKIYINEIRNIIRRN